MGFPFSLFAAVSIIYSITISSFTNHIHNSLFVPTQNSICLIVARKIEYRGNAVSNIAYSVSVNKNSKDAKLFSDPQLSVNDDIPVHQDGQDINNQSSGQGTVDTHYVELDMIGPNRNFFVNANGSTSRFDSGIGRQRPDEIVIYFDCRKNLAQCQTGEQRMKWAFGILFTIGFLGFVIWAAMGGLTTTEHVN